MLPAVDGRNDSIDDSDEAIDLNQFQASLDESVAVVRAMIDSWVPRDLGPRWNVDFGAPEMVLRPAGSVNSHLVLIITFSLSSGPVEVPTADPLCARITE